MSYDNICIGQFIELARKLGEFPSAEPHILFICASSGWIQEMEWFSTSQRGTSGTKRTYAETDLDTYENPHRLKDFRVRSRSHNTHRLRDFRVRSRSQSPDYLQLPPMIVTDQQHQLTRQYSFQSAEYYSDMWRRGSMKLLGT